MTNEELASIEETEKVIARDTVMFVYGQGAEALPEELGEGVCMTTTKDGGLQLAFYFTDLIDGERRTLMVQGGMLRFFDSLADMLSKGVKAARKREVIQMRGELTPGRGTGS